MTYLAVVATVLCLTQGTPLDGSWELTRIFRSGPSTAPRAVPLDSTVYVRLSLDSHTGGWFTGALYRRYRGQRERTELSGGPLGGTGRWRSEEHTSELPSPHHLVCRLLLDKKQTHPHPHPQPISISTY